MNLLPTALLLLAVAAPPECDDHYLHSLDPNNVNCRKISEIYSRIQALAVDYASTARQAQRECVALKRQDDELKEEYRRKTDQLNAKHDRVIKGLEKAIEKITYLNDAWWKTEKMLREGLYCSKCEKSKHEIEQDGTTDFYEHLRKVKGVVKPAPEALIRKKYTEYVTKREQYRRELKAYDHTVYFPCLEEGIKLEEDKALKFQQIRDQFSAVYQRGYAASAKSLQCRDTAEELGRHWCLHR